MAIPCFNGTSSQRALAISPADGVLVAPGDDVHLAIRRTGAVHGVPEGESIMLSEELELQGFPRAFLGLST